MGKKVHSSPNRRQVMRAATATIASGLLSPVTSLASPAMETTRLRLVKIPSICQAPQYMAEEMLALEGFTDIKYVKKNGTVGIQEALASGEADVNNLFASPLIRQVDEADPIVIIGGLHVGCFELFTARPQKRLTDLAGKSLAVWNLGSAQHLFLASILSYVGVDPENDINWVLEPPAVAKKLLAEKKIDAYLGFPPDPQELRDKKIGHVLLDSTVDKPWSHYFCCLIAGNRDFVRNHPVATKHALRAILKANRICATQPERAARFVVDRGFTSEYQYALDNMQRIPYDRWSQYQVEDTVRFYSLRLREAGLIKSTPEEILKRGCDFKIFNELQRELKA